MTANSSKPLVLIYADVNLAIIDGSTSWLISVAHAFARAGSDVHVVAREVPDRTLILDELRSHPSVSVVFASIGKVGSPDEVVEAVHGAVRKNSYSFVVIRGVEIARRLSEHDQVRKILWPYVVSLPKPSDPDFEEATGVWRDLADHSRGLLVQTKYLRDYVESLFPAVGGRTQVFEPVVPDLFFERKLPRRRPETMELAYAGKFDKPWHALEIPFLAEELNKRGIKSRVKLIGDKVQRAKDEPGWHVEMASVIEAPPRSAEFTGGVSRSDVPRFLEGATFGLGWRSNALDSSFEISTKLLEFSAMGIPTVCNRTSIHQDLFGEDYPLFVDDSKKTVLRVLEAAWQDVDIPSLRKHVREKAWHFSLTEAAARVHCFLEECAPGNRLLRQRVFSGVRYLQKTASASSVLLEALQSGLGPVVLPTPVVAGRSVPESDLGEVTIADWAEEPLEALAQVQGTLGRYVFVDENSWDPDLADLLPPDLDGLLYSGSIDFASVADKMNSARVSEVRSAVPSARESRPDGSEVVTAVVLEGDVRGLSEAFKAHRDWDGAGPALVELVVVGDDRLGAQQRESFDQQLQLFFGSVLHRDRLAFQRLPSYSGRLFADTHVAILFGRAALEPSLRQRVEQMELPFVFASGNTYRSQPTQPGPKGQGDAFAVARELLRVELRDQAGNKVSCTNLNARLFDLLSRVAWERGSRFFGVGQS